MAVPQIPFTIVALAPFSVVPESSYKPRLFEAEALEIDNAIKQVEPSVSVEVPLTLHPEGRIDLRISSMSSFTPDGLIEATPFLKNIRDARDAVRSGLAKGESADAIYGGLRSFPGLPVKIEHTAATAKGSAASESSSTVDDILSMVSVGGGGGDAPAADGGGSSGEPSVWEKDLDRALSQLALNIFSNPDFRRFESAWRGLDLLLQKARDGAGIKVIICPVSFAALDEAIERLENQLIDLSPSLLIVDLCFDVSAYSFAVLEKLGGLCENLFAPGLVSIDNSFFHLPRWDDLHKLSYIPHLLDEPQFAKWRKIRGTGAGAWLSAAANGVLTRKPYDKNNQPATVSFIEGKHLYVGPSWALGASVARSFAGNGWPSGFTYRGGAILNGLATRGGEGEPEISTAAVLDEDRSRQMIDSGIVPIVARAGKGEVTVPQALTMSGESLEHQFVLARVIALILWCKDNLSAGGDADEIQRSLEAAFGDFWRSTGHEPPEDMRITVTDNGASQPLLVSISLTPGGKVLPTEQTIELNLNW